MDAGSIVYHIETPQQFWQELHDILHSNFNLDFSLDGLDQALETFITVCANNHERFLQTNAQLEHACEILLDTDLFGVHSQRSTERIMKDALTNPDPHAQLIRYRLLHSYGQRNHPGLFKNLRLWSPLFPQLMDHILVDIYDEYSYAWGAGGSGNAGNGAGMGMGMGIPIEARLRGISVVLLYEVCRVQRIELNDLKQFSEDFINYLFELVEETRSNPDETLNYSLIKLIVALNEQFMVAALPPSSSSSTSKSSPSRKSNRKNGVVSPAPPEGSTAPPQQTLPNRVLQVLMRRLGNSKTFGENLIFMLNRAEDTPEDLCMQLLILKLLYLLFTTPGTQEYFYTNDLRVLVDVFIRELVDLPEERESLRHTYLRVLHPLMVNTQLRTYPYKRLQILNVLQSLVAHAHIRDVSSTAVRLVERCLKAPWAVDLELEIKAKNLIIADCPPQRTDHDANAHGTSSTTAPPNDNLSLKPPKQIHKSASTDLSGHGRGLLTLSVPTTSISASAELMSAAVTSDRKTLEEPIPDPPRSADPTRPLHMYKPALGRRPTGRRRMTKEAEVDPIMDTDSSSGSSPVGGPASVIAIEVTSPTGNRPRTSSLVDSNTRHKPPIPSKDKSLPPPRPPPLHQRRSSEDKTAGDWCRLQPLRTSPEPMTASISLDPPTRASSVSEITRSGVDGKNTVFESTTLTLSPQPIRPLGLRQDSSSSAASILMTAPSSGTPPPMKHRRKAPPIPVGGRRGGSGGLSASRGVVGALEIPVGRFAVPS